MGERFPESGDAFPRLGNSFPHAGDGVPYLGRPVPGSARDERTILLRQNLLRFSALNRCVTGLNGTVIISYGILKIFLSSPACRAGEETPQKKHSRSLPSGLRTEGNDPPKCKNVKKQKAT